MPNLNEQDQNQEPKQDQKPVENVWKISADGKEHTFDLSKPEDLAKAQEAIQFGIPGKRIYAERDKMNRTLQEKEREYETRIAQMSGQLEAMQAMMSNLGNQQQAEAPEKGTLEYAEWMAERALAENQRLKQDLARDAEERKKSAEVSKRIDVLIAQVESEAEWDDKAGKSGRYPNLTIEDLEKATHMVYGGTSAEDALGYLASLRGSTAQDEEQRIKAAAAASVSAPRGGSGPPVTTTHKPPEISLKGKSFRQALSQLAEASENYRKSFSGAAKG